MGTVESRLAEPQASQVGGDVKSSTLLLSFLYSKSVDLARLILRFYTGIFLGWSGWLISVLRDSLFI